MSQVDVQKLRELEAKICDQFADSYDYGTAIQAAEAIRRQD